MNIKVEIGRPFYSGWRCLHKGELGGYADTPNGMPEVRPSVNAPPVDFTEDLQWLSWRLTQRFNSSMTSKQWRTVYKDDIAFTNENGFDKEGDPRADYINGTNLDRALPKLMKAIIVGGSFYRGVVEGDKLVMYPGVHAIDANKPLPTLEEVINNQWFFYAVVWYANYTMSPFPQGNGGDVVVPYALREPTGYPIEWFIEWNSTELPNPLVFYNL